MTPRKSLRAVADGETPPVSKSVTQAAGSGTKRELLVAMRDRIAKDVENPNTASRDLAALTKRLLEVVNDIEAMDARDEQEAARSGPTDDEAWTAV